MSCLSKIDVSFKYFQNLLVDSVLMLCDSGVKRANVLEDELEDGLESTGVELHSEDGFEVEGTLDAFESYVAVTGHSLFAHINQILFITI